MNKIDISPFYRRERIADIYNYNKHIYAKGAKDGAYKLDIRGSMGVITNIIYADTVHNTNNLEIERTNEHNPVFKVTLFI
jgi:hypothetical protein